MDCDVEILVEEIDTNRKKERLWSVLKYFLKGDNCPHSKEFGIKLKDNLASTSYDMCPYILSIILLVSACVIIDQWKLLWTFN